MKNEFRVMLVRGHSNAPPPAIPIETIRMGNKSIVSALSPLMEDLLAINTAKVISAPTGAGKTHFLVNHVITEALKRHMKILYVSSRIAVNLQQKEALAKVLGDGEILKRLSPYGLQTQENIAGVRVMTYHRLFELYNDAEEQERLQEIQLFVFDEIHALMHDALFVSFTGDIIKNIPTVFRKASRIYISATPAAILDELAIVEKGESLPVYTFRSSYKHIDPYFFTNADQIIELINSDESDQKWLIFVPYLKLMETFARQLKCSYTTLTAATREKAPEMWQALLSKEQFSEKVMITTSVIDAGVNFHDPMLSNIVTFSLDADEVIQQVGRKRRLRKEEKIKLFALEPSLQRVTRRIYKLTEMDKAFDASNANIGNFINRFLLKEESSEYRKCCFADSSGRINVNHLARKRIAQNLDSLRRLQTNGQKHGGDCKFASVLLKALCLSPNIASSHWLDERYSNEAKEKLLSFLKDHTEKAFATEEDRAIFSRQYRKLYTSAYGARANDRPDREWGATVIKKTLANINCGLVLKVASNTWILTSTI